MRHSSIMQFNRMLLMCSALITIAYSFPAETETEYKKVTSAPQTNKSGLNTKENKKPFIFIMEEKNPKSDSIVVQFVYSSNGGNSITESKGSGKDKYIVNQSKNKEKTEEKSNINEKEKSVQGNKTEHASSTKLKANTAKAVQLMTASAALTPEEITPFSGKWPKYIYDALNPIQSLPELEFEKQNQMNPVKVQNEKADSFLTYPIKEKKESLNIAGPQLNPLSIYDREFNVPIFE